MCKQRNLFILALFFGETARCRFFFVIPVQELAMFYCERCEKEFETLLRWRQHCCRPAKRHYCRSCGELFDHRAALFHHLKTERHFINPRLQSRDHPPARSQRRRFPGREEYSDARLARVGKLRLDSLVENKNHRDNNTDVKTNKNPCITGEPVAGPSMAYSPPRRQPQEPLDPCSIPRNNDHRVRNSKDFTDKVKSTGAAAALPRPCALEAADCLLDLPIQEDDLMDCQQEPLIPPVDIPPAPLPFDEEHLLDLDLDLDEFNLDAPLAEWLLDDSDDAANSDDREHREK